MGKEAKSNKWQDSSFNVDGTFGMNGSPNYGSHYRSIEYQTLIEIHVRIRVSAQRGEASQRVSTGEARFLAWIRRSFMLGHANIIYLSADTPAP